MIQRRLLYDLTNGPNRATSGSAANAAQLFRAFPCLTASRRLRE
jgi:hypothetical protein